MYTSGQRVVLLGTTRAGTVHHLENGAVFVDWDDNPGILAAEHSDVLIAIEDAPGPSKSPDIVHAAMLRHAVNAGAAVTALEIIRREAKRGLTTNDMSSNYPLEDSLKFIERFADDVLSQVLPALPAQSYNHVPCLYCGRMLDDGESHLHGGAPNPPG